MARRRSTATPPLKFDQKLVLKQWMLGLFEVKDFDRLADPLKQVDLEGLDVLASLSLAALAPAPLAPKQFTLYPLVSVRPSLDSYT
ncbi:MAG: hypothetical protein ABIP48_32290 [Planctomycetota bacterium]